MCKGNKKTFFSLTSTKLLVIKCWYLSLTRESVTNFITVTSSTMISHPWAAQDIDWPRPSSMIFVVKYSPQQFVQNLWPHSKPVIICQCAWMGETKKKAKLLIIYVAFHLFLHLNNHVLIKLVTRWYTYAWRKVRETNFTFFGSRFFCLQTVEEIKYQFRKKNSPITLL